MSNIKEQTSQGHAGTPATSPTRRLKWEGDLFNSFAVLAVIVAVVGLDHTSSIVLAIAAALAFIAAVGRVMVARKMRS